MGCRQESGLAQPPQSVGTEIADPIQDNTLGNGEVDTEVNYPETQASVVQFAPDLVENKLDEAVPPPPVFYAAMAMLHIVGDDWEKYEILAKKLAIDHLQIFFAPNCERVRQEGWMDKPPD